METVIVTGANRGIGIALVKALSQSGFRVIAGARDPNASDELAQLAKSAPKQIRFFGLDVTSEKSVELFVANITEVQTPVDVLVNNAGVMPEEGHEEIATIDLQLFRTAFDVNVLGVARMTSAVLPFLEQSRRPRILNFSSRLGSVADRENHFYYAYATSKAALNMLTRSIAFELGPKGITTVAISPGWVRTEMGGGDADLSPEQSARSLVEAIETVGPELNGEFLDRHGKPGKYNW